jgi:hypothetical protein
MKYLKIIQKFSRIMSLPEIFIEFLTVIENIKNVENIEKFFNNI